MKSFLLILFSLFLSPDSKATGKAYVWKTLLPLEIRVGDIVVRKGHGTWTQYFINCSSREKRFSHVGIVVSNEAQCTIVHSDANEWTGIGAVRLESWHGFYADTLECAVFRFDGDSSVASNIAINAKRRLGVKFDSAFDMGETNRLYCSEMIRLAINEAVGTNLVGFTKVCGRNVVAIDDLYRNGFRRIYDSHHPELCTNEDKSHKP